jgi:hypothetical protein
MQNDINADADGAREYRATRSRTKQDSQSSYSSSDIGERTVTAERSRRSADGNEELTGVGDRKRSAARLGTPVRCAKGRAMEEKA